MSFGKWSTVAMGGACAAMVAAALFALPALGITGAGEIAVQGGAAIVIGMTVASIHRGFVGTLRNDVRSLTCYVEALPRTDSRSTPFVSTTVLDELAQTINTTFSSLRKRIEQLVTQRRELEVEARLADAQRRHAEAILNSINDAVVVTDAFNEIALANDAAARVLSFDLSHAMRKPVDRVVHDQAIIKLIKDTREGGDPTLRRHVEHKLGGNGDSATFDVTLACVMDDKRQSAAPERVGVVTILRDITREKEISEMKSDFVANVSHELRTPLSSIKAYMEMLVDGEAQNEETRLEFYNIIQGEANRLSRLIDNILNISRIESGVVKVQREQISLLTIIKDVIDVMQPQARAKQIELIEAPCPAVFQVFADKDMIYQATLNLVGNAVKYSMPGSRVTIAVDVNEAARMVSVSISDTGVGIPPADLPHLFEKFYRVAEHNKLAKGTGLGLNLVKNIIETVHGGKVSVSSEVGKGSTFTYSLPMAEGEA